MIFTPCARNGISAETASAILYQDYGVGYNAGYWDWLTTRDNPYRGREGYLNVQLAYEKMRRVALAEKYSAVWIVESDVIPPLDALGKLLETSREQNAPIVTGLYVLRHGANVPNLFSFGKSREIGSSYGWDVLKQLRAKQGDVIPTSGGCMGCVLVRPEALDFDFYLHARDETATKAPDMDWMRHNWQRGRVTVARLDVQCGHVDSDGTILRPEDFL